MPLRKDQLPLTAKNLIAELVLAEALGDNRKPVLVWTGGKDSTLVFHLALEVARREGLEVPPLLFVDHGQHFPETWSFMEDIARREGLHIIVAKNEELLAESGDDLEPLALDFRLKASCMRDPWSL